MEMEKTGRLIDADALEIRVEIGHTMDGLLLIPMRDVKKSIENAPTIEAEPVRHGRWRYVGDNNVFACSECKKVIETAYCRYECYYRHCPNCGAKMDGAP